jgi:hypothetical protein
VHTFPCRERHQNSLERRRKLAHERHFSPKVNGKTSLSIGNLFISVEDHPRSEKQNREARVFHVKHSFPSKEKFRALTRAHPQSFSHPSLELVLQQSTPSSLRFYTPQRKKFLVHLHTQNNRSTMRDISNQHNHDVDNHKHVVIAFTYNRSTLLCTWRKAAAKESHHPPVFPSETVPLRIFRGRQQHVQTRHSLPCHTEQL